MSFGQGIAEKVSLSSLPTELVFYSSGKKSVFHPSRVTSTIEVVVCAAFSLSGLLQVFVAFSITAIVVGKFILEEIERMYLWKCVLSQQPVLLCADETPSYIRNASH